MPTSFPQPIGGTTLFPTPAPVQRPIPGYDLIDDQQTSGLRTWSSQRIAAEIAVASMGGGGGAGELLATAVTGVNAIDLTVPGLILTATEALVWFRPVGAPGAGGVTIGVGGSAKVALVDGLGQPVVEGAWPAGYPIKIAISTAGAQIFTGP